MHPISRPGARLCGEAAHDVISEEAINGMRGPWQPVSALGNDGGRARLRAMPNEVRGNGLGKGLP